MAQTAKKNIETTTVVVETDERAQTNGVGPATSGVQYRHPDPERERELMAMVDETWPDIEETIRFLRDN